MPILTHLPTWTPKVTLPAGEKKILPGNFAKMRTRQDKAMSLTPKKLVNAYMEFQRLKDKSKMLIPLTRREFRGLQSICQICLNERMIAGWIVWTPEARTLLEKIARDTEGVALAVVDEIRENPMERLKKGK